MYPIIQLAQNTELVSYANFFNQNASNICVEHNFQRNSSTFAHACANCAFGVYANAFAAFAAPSKPDAELL